MDIEKEGRIIPTEHNHDLIEKGRLYDALKIERDKILRVLKKIKKSERHGFIEIQEGNPAYDVMMDVLNEIE